MCYEKLEQPLKFSDIRYRHWLQFGLWSNNVTGEVQAECFLVAINLRRREEMNAGQNISSSNDNGRRDSGNMDVDLLMFISVSKFKWCKINTKITATCFAVNTASSGSL